jgi:two-component system, chemotaxis family, sensor kinase CheA
MKKLLSTIVLPSEISEFERRYLQRMNRIGLGFFALHLPVLAIIAHFNDTGVLNALGLTLAVLAGPAIAYKTLDNPRAISMSYGFTSMLMGGLLVHFGQGPVQIEMHFYFFALLAMLALYGNPSVILIAAVTVALHHLLLWMFLPSSVFNYAAPIWVVAVHAGFVVLESIGTIFIARSFFDNVIGLEKIVNERTRALDARNRDLRLVLDNVQQGLVTIGLDGVLSQERSAAVDAWLGPVPAGTTLAEQLSRISPEVGQHCEGAWEQVVEGAIMPELSLDQMPKRIVADDRWLDISYIPISNGAELREVLVVLSDVTSDVERERLEAEQREAMEVFDRVMRDRAGFLEFFHESERQIGQIAEDSVEDAAVLKRILHTLKGNAALFRLQTIAELCHQMETRLVEDGERPKQEQRDQLVRRWRMLAAGLESLLGGLDQGKIEIDEAEYQTILAYVRDDATRDQLTRIIESWKLEPARRRLARVAEQAEAIATRLDKSGLEVTVEHGDLRLDSSHWASFWSAFVHVVRNAVDHGIESTLERRAAGKPEHGSLRLRTRLEAGEFVVEIADDGRGVNWEAIAQRAQLKGISFASRTDLVEALFSEGISTTQIATEYSGRGIGMGAARQACQERGGKMLIHSSEGQGTRIEFRFPNNQVVESLPARLVA